MGPPQCSRPTGPDGATPPRPHRCRHGRTRTGRVAARLGFAFDGPATAPMARSGAARSARGLQGISPTRPSQIRSAGRRRPRCAAPVPDGVRASARRRPRGTRISPRWRVPRRRTPNAAHQLRPGWDACRHRAWADCSTPSPRWRASGRFSPTKPRRQSSSKAGRGVFARGRTHCRRCDAADGDLDPGPGPGAIVRDCGRSATRRDLCAIPPSGGSPSGRPRRSGRRPHRRVVRRGLPEPDAAAPHPASLMETGSMSHPPLVPPNDGGIALGQLLVGNRD